MNGSTFARKGHTVFILAITISIISGRYSILKYKETKGRRIKSSGQTPFNIITKKKKTASPKKKFLTQRKYFPNFFFNLKKKENHFYLMQLLVGTLQCKKNVEIKFLPFFLAKNSNFKS